MDMVTYAYWRGLYVPAGCIRAPRFRGVDPQLFQLYQIIHIHLVTIFNNGTFDETIPGCDSSLCLW